MNNTQAIRLLKTKKGQPSTDYQLGEALQVAISAIEKQEQNRWHVVAEEGNPPKMGFYLWCARGGAVEIDFFDGEKWEKASTYLYEVLAWKYCPKAYTEENA